MIIPAVEPLSNSSAIILEPSSCNDLHRCRTIWNIIWSSFFTLFACVWLSVHPNIPAPNDSWGRKGTRRVWTMIAVLLAPELLVGWAMRQRILASKIAKENKKHGWTKTHGFFVVMGGFMECDKGGQPIRTVTVDDVDSITENTKRHILEEDINDKSKGDVLSKSFAVLQTGWFILQCISRTIEDFPVTELEIATGAFCVLNFATYILWWNKPLSVRRPIRVYAGGTRPEEAEEEGVEDDKARIPGTWTTFKQGLADIPNEVCRPIADMVKQFGVLSAILGFPYLLINIILEGESMETNPQRVGTFGPEHKGTRWDQIMGAAVGTVFGAIHCTAWMSQFPSHTEQVLWRVAAVSVTAIPLLIALLGRVFHLRTDTLSSFNFIATTAIFLYVLARLTLLVLPLMSLRSLPPGAFVSVNWIRFIPHV